MTASWRLLLFAYVMVVGCTGKYVRPTTAESVGNSPEAIQRGSYIVNNVSSCGACHTTRENGDLANPTKTVFLGGGNTLSEHGMKLFIPNITPDAETGIGKWTDDQVMRAIRDGVGADDKLMFPIMPFGSYQRMSDADVRAVTAYLKTVPAAPLPGGKKEHELPFYMSMAVSMGMTHHRPAAGVPEPDRSDKVKYGEYLMWLGGCSDCHSLTSRGPREPTDDQWFGGADMPSDLDGVGKVWAPNLTPDPETGLGKYSTEEIIAAIRAGKRLDGQMMAPPMSLFIPHIAGMTDEDLTALVSYLKSLKPVKKRVPARELTSEGKKLVGEG